MDCHPVGLREISDMLNVSNVLLAQWKKRGKLPTPIRGEDGKPLTVGGNELWDWNAQADEFKKLCHKA